jgi:imidazolonepropionase-like amidohydrolase
MKKLILLSLIVSIFYSCSKPDKYDVVIQNVDLFDGYEYRGMVNVAINLDTIAAISASNLSGDTLIDASGKYMIPGLVNAHVHVSRKEQLKEGFPLGILTLLNMHTGLEDREMEWKKISRDSSGYSVLYGSGHAGTVPGGHPNQFSPDMETINDSVSIEDWMNHRMAKQVDYIKIVRDHHEFIGYPPLPTLSYDQIGQLVSAAHENGYRAVVHSNTVEEMVKIAEFKPDGFVHMLDYIEDYPVPDSYYQALAESGAFIVTTGGISLKSLDGAPPPIREWFEKNSLNPKQRAEIINKLFEHEVLIVAGTDAQEGQMNFGDDYFLELELYKMAGIPNLEILKAATGNAAKAFGLPIGEITVGGKADLVLLSENPIDDIDNLSKVEQVWKNGKTN